jgi:hypothetical protein
MVKMKKLENYTDTELKHEFESLYDIIEIAECYSCSDLQLYYAVQEELAKRGIELKLRVEWKDSE